MKKITVVNNKGGVGKTFSCAALSMKLKDKGPCIAIDNDSQGNLSLLLSTRDIRDENTSSTIYSPECFIKAYPATVRTSLENEDREVVENLFISTANEFLAKCQREASATSIFGMANACRKAGEDYAYTVIDCPPGSGIAQEMALYAADYILIPIQPDVFSIEGVRGLIGTLNDIAENRATAPVIRMFLNGVSYQNRGIADEIRAAMHAMYPEYMSTIEVPFQQAFYNAASYFIPITTYSKIKKKRSAASAAYDLLIKELEL